MGRKPKQTDLAPGGPEQDGELAPITAMMSSRLMVLANLGRHPPMSVVRLADAVGLDKGQISRALAEKIKAHLEA